MHCHALPDLRDARLLSGAFLDSSEQALRIGQGKKTDQEIRKCFHITSGRPCMRASQVFAECASRVCNEGHRDGERGRASARNPVLIDSRLRQCTRHQRRGDRTHKLTHGTRACGPADRQQAKRPRRVRGPLAREIAQVREGVEGACARKTPTTGMWRAARPRMKSAPAQPARPALRRRLVDEQPAVEALCALT